MSRAIYPRRGRFLAACVGVVALVSVTACGSDDDGDATNTAAAPDAADTSEPTPDAGTTPTSSEPGDSGPSASIAAEFVEFCAVAAELDQQDSPPTMEQFDEYVAAAPDELQEPLQVIADALEEAGGDFMALFGNDEVEPAIEQLDSVEAQACGLGSEDDGPPQDPSVTVLDPNATLVEVEASEYEFDAEYPSEAGRYSFVMTNVGEEAHIMILAHLEDDADLDDVLASEGEEGIVDIFESDVGAQGEEAVISADLVEGRWVLLCPLPSPEGQPHFTEGMINEFDIG